MKKKAKKENPYVGIAGTIGGTLIAMIAIITLFAREHSWVIAPVVICMMILGIFLGHFASK